MTQRRSSSANTPLANVPKLKVSWRQRDADQVTLHALDIENAIVTFRLLVHNKGREAARHVEAFVTDAYKDCESEGYRLAEGFLPTILKWTHSELPSCAYLPAGAKRLFDLGT